MALNLLEAYNLPLLGTQRHDTTHGTRHTTHDTTRAATHDIFLSPATAGPTAQAYHWVAEALAFAYADRMGLADPQFADLHNLTHVMVPVALSARNTHTAHTRTWHNTTHAHAHTRSWHNTTYTHDTQCVTYG